MCAVMYGLRLAYSNLEESPPTLWEPVHYFWVLSSLTETKGLTQSEVEQYYKK